MKIYLGSDHAGFELKNSIKEFLVRKRYDVEDCGADTLNPDDDYPDFIKLVAEKISQHPEERGIVFGGSGQAEMMTANKFPHVRAALFYGPVEPHEAVDVSGRKTLDPFEIVRLTRMHNNANILSIGARFVSIDDVKHAITIWLTTDFSGGHHQRRIEKILEIERSLAK